MIWLLFLALSGGVVLATQAGINGELGRGLKSPILAALISFSVGTLSLLLYAFVSRARFPDGQALAAIPKIAWVAGGMLGAFYLLTTILVPPRIGVAAFFSLVVLGQLCASLIFDHFGLLGLPTHPVNPWRVLGVALLIVGVALIRRF